MKSKTGNIQTDYSVRYNTYEKFNRVLYGGHDHDDQEGRFFTFAGDTPIFMGCASDYTKDTWCYQAKNGVLMSGMAMTPGYDGFAGFFHNCCDITAKWHHGYMSYEMTGFTAFFPDVKVKIEVYPLFPDDGFLVHYDITTDQRVIFCAGLGGITEFFGRFEYHDSARREFSKIDCVDNHARIDGKCGIISGPGDVKMFIGTDFDCEWSTDSADAMCEPHPGLFLNDHEGNAEVVKLRKVLEQNTHFCGNILVMKDSSCEKVAEYLARKDLIRYLRSRIRAKYASVAFNTPDKLLNDTVTDTIIAQDAAFHGKSFYHGAIGYHAPFLGWRGWYAPVLLGWADRVKAAIRSHFDTITRFEKPEKVWWDGADRPDLDHEGTQYHHIENSSGHLTALLYRDDIYDMQEVAIDMTLYYLEHSGDMQTCADIYDRLCELLDWEERILDPDGDGIYQNFLNTWISDGHSYNGAGCAQASSYNYAANIRTANLGKLLGKDTSKLDARAAKIQKAFQQQLWQDNKGVPAESIDTIGNKLVHDVPELSTIYLAADCHNTGIWQTFRMLKFTERFIKSFETAGRGGRLYFSSNWLPKKYSTCGIFPAENACLALTYFQNGQPEKAMEIVNGIADGYLLSPYPGSITHVFSGRGGMTGGDIDFTDVSSCYLRLLIEGLWGVRFKRTSGLIEVMPQLPDEWDNASLSLPEIAIAMKRDTLRDQFTITLQGNFKRLIRLPLRYAGVDQLFVNGEECSYRIIPGFNRSFIEFATTDSGTATVQLYYTETAYPQISGSSERISFAGNCELLEINAGIIEDVTIFNPCIEAVNTCAGTMLKIAADAAPGEYDCIVNAKLDNIRVMLPVTIKVKALEAVVKPAITGTEEQTQFDLQDKFNAALTEIHKQEFRSPRPEGYSIGMRLNGRYAWEWNHYGHNALNPDDSLLRSCGGKLTTASGLQFLTPATGNNCVTVSVWDNFPTETTIPLTGKGKMLAVLLCGTTHAMQSYVVNGVLSVVYADGSESSVELIHQENFDDFLISSYQKENEIVYFSDGTHGSVQLIALDPAKEIAALKVKAVALEVIINILGITLLK